jgi:intracellular sulfur oxidation DsrE/DsrF family protein
MEAVALVVRLVVIPDGQAVEAHDHRFAGTAISQHPHGGAGRRLIECGLRAARRRGRRKQTADAEGCLSSVDLDKVSFALGNIRNHFDGMGGPDKVAIALVASRRRIRQGRARAQRFIVADRGGVVRIAELQSMGYAYLRP